MTTSLGQPVSSACEGQERGHLKNMALTMDLARQMCPQAVPREGEPGLLQISKAGMPVFC